jgi:translation initiation factor 1 (eIF-1/SUI1)
MDLLPVPLFSVPFLTSLHSAPLRNKEIRGLKAGVLRQYPKLGEVFEATAAGGAFDSKKGRGTDSEDEDDETGVANSCLDLWFPRGQSILASRGPSHDGRRVSLYWGGLEGSQQPLLYGLEFKPAAPTTTKAVKSKTTDDHTLFVPLLPSLWQVASACTPLTSLPLAATSAILPAAFTSSHASEFIIKSGADVMWAGVVRSHGLRPGVLAAVYVVGNAAPYAIGIATGEDTADTAEGRPRGKAIIVLHRYRDALFTWLASSAYAKGVSLVPNAGFTQNRVNRYPSLGRTDAMSEEDEEDTALHEDHIEKAAAGAGEATHGDETHIADTGEEREEVRRGGPATRRGGDVSTYDCPPIHVDDMAMFSLLQVLKRHLKDKDLPVLASALAPLMQAAKREGWDVDMKRTKWKKLSVLLKELGTGKDSLLHLSEEKGVLKLESINRVHESYIAFRPWGVGHEADKSAATTTTDAEIVHSYVSPLLLEAAVPPPCMFPLLREAVKAKADFSKYMFAVKDLKAGTTDAIQTLLAHANSIKTLRPILERVAWVREYVTSVEGFHLPELSISTAKPEQLAFSSDLREMLKTYLSAHRLTYFKDKSRVVLDEVLADALTGPLRKDTAADAAVVETDVGDVSVDATMPREDVVELFTQRLATVYLIFFPMFTASGAVASVDCHVHRGKTPRIHIHVKSLQGGKRHLTLVGGLDAYRIDPSVLARDASRRFAASASTTVGTEAGWVAPGTSGDDALLQLQGNFGKDMMQLLCSDRESGGWGLGEKSVQQS